MTKIPFNKPYLSPNALSNVEQVFRNKKASGNGIFTELCHEFFGRKYGFKKSLLTTSCTDALEMAAILCDIEPGDEVIMPSYTFVSTANAFVLRGAKIRFADSMVNHPNVDPESIPGLITSKTRAIVVVHYGGVACAMDEITAIAHAHNLVVVEDAAQSIDSYYHHRPLGSIGQLATFSFHETKNIQCGEGGMLAINDERYLERAEIIWEKGTNRSAFFRGETDKYSWIDVGSSFLPSEIISAFLFAQLEMMEEIQNRRKIIWKYYHDRLSPLSGDGLFDLQEIPEFATNNGHLFALVCKSGDERSALIKFLNEHDINAVFHYLTLHKSPYYADKHDGRDLPNADHYSDCLIRLPLFYELKEEQIDYIVEKISEFYK